MPYKAPLVLPVTSPDDPGSPWPNQLQLPIQTRQTIDASQDWFDNTQDAASVANGIVDYYSSSVGNFVDTQRRDYGAGIVSVHSKFLNLPGLTLQYENQHGQERLTMTAYPESAPTGATGVEVNNDGYIFWAHADPRYPDLVDNKPTFQTPYDIFLNGYLVYSGFKITGIAQGFVIMFGKTALRCHSVIEYDQSSTNPFKDGQFGTNQIWGPNGGLVNDLAPPFQPPVKGTQTPDNLDVPAHPNEFLYSLFDWGNNNNPGALMTEGFIGSVPSYGRWMGQGGIGQAPTIMNGVQFAFPEKSPLNLKGQNYLTIMLKAGAIGEENLVVDSVVVEFYDRGTFSGASQTWSYTSGGRSVRYTLNDKPLLWCASLYASKGSQNMSMGFDLTPKAKSTEANNALLTDLSQPNSSFAQGTYLGLTAAQQAALAEYAMTVTALINAFNASQAPIIAAAILALSVGEQTLANINSFILEYSGTFDKNQTVPSTFTFTNETGRPTPLTGLQSVDNFISASTTVEGDWIVSVSEAAFYVILQAGLQEQTDIVVGLTATYIAAITAQPNLPSPPPNAGTPLDAFVWRNVSISGSEWEFDDWQNL